MQNLALLGSLPAGIRSTRSTSRHSQHFVCPIPHHKCHRKATTRRHQGTPQGVRPESGPHSGLLWDLHTTRALDTGKTRHTDVASIHAACMHARQPVHIITCSLQRAVSCIVESGGWERGIGPMGGGGGELEIRDGVRREER